jgi:hypothetical protein
MPLFTCLLADCSPPSPRVAEELGKRAFGRIARSEPIRSVMARLIVDEEDFAISNIKLPSRPHWLAFSQHRMNSAFRQAHP